MAYRLSTGDQPVSRQLHQIFLEQIDSAAEHLSKSTAEDRDTRIHEARKDIKKIRALLRLVAHQLGKSTFRSENHRFRDIARKLSQLRDAHAIIESFTALPDGALTPRSRTAFLKRLQAEKARVYQSLDVEQVLAATVAALKESRPCFEAFELKGNGFGAIEPGLLSIYRQGRKALKKARATSSPDNLHDLRKRVKDHGYHIRLLTGLNVAFLDGRQAAVRDLETALGEAHNLHVLRQSLQVGKTNQKVLTALAAREEELGSEALYLASSLYHWKTRQLEKELSGLHQLWTKPSANKSNSSHKPPVRETSAVPDHATPQAVTA